MGIIYAKTYFLSHRVPHTRAQEAFLGRVKKKLEQPYCYSQTLGVSDYGLDTPLGAICRVLSMSHSLLMVAFKTTKTIFKKRWFLFILPCILKKRRKHNGSNNKYQNLG